MEIKNLESFRTVAELRSFTRAADALGFTQSTISFQIRQLEDELGAPLFERNNRTVTLTNEGRRLLPLAYDILRLSAEAAHIGGNSEEPRGLVRLGIAESLANWQMREKFARFHQSHPLIHLQLITGSTEDTFLRLQRNQVDLIYTLDRKVSDRKYIIAREAPVPMHFVARRDHPLAGQKHISAEMLLQSDLLLTEKDMSYRALLDEALASVGSESEPIMEAGDTHLICELLRQGVGVSCLPDFVVEEDIARGTLVTLDVPDIRLDLWRQLLYNRNKWVSPEMQSVIEVLSEE